jgi:iron(III) transport system permease protein
MKSSSRSSEFEFRIVTSAIVIGALTAILIWPAVAIVREALISSEPVAAGSLFDPLAMTGTVARPLRLALETLRVVAVTEAIALPAGVVLALLLFRTDLWGRRVLLGLASMSLFVPMPLHATAWLGAIGNAGRSQALGGAPILVGWFGAAFVHAMAAQPWVVLIAGLGMRTVERELEESALLEMPAWRVALAVTVRRSVGAIAGAALAVAVLTAGDMTVTDLLQVRTYAEEVYLQAQLGKGPAAVMVTLPPLLVLGSLIVVGANLLVRADPARIASTQVRARMWRLEGWRVPLGILVMAVAGGLLSVPIYGLIWRAGRVAGSAAKGLPPHWSPHGLAGTLVGAWQDVSLPSYLMPSPLVGSVICASLGATVTVILAWLLAWKCRAPGPWRWVTTACVAVSLAAPGPIVGMAFKHAYLSIPFIHNTATIVIMGYVLRTLPYALIVLWPTLRAIPEEYLESAAVDGRGPWGQIRTIALPLSRAAILAAWGVAFVFALGELPATNILLPPGLTTIATLVWALLHTGVESHLAGVGLILLLIFGAVGSGASIFLRSIFQITKE